MAIHKIQPLKLNKDTLASVDTIDLSGITYSSMDYGAIPPFSNLDTTASNVSFSSGTNTTYTSMPSVTIGQGLTSANAVWTTSATGTNYNWSAVGASINPSATISLKGENADIDINGKSMKDWMEKVEERLNILTPNPELEKEWDDLRKLGERYRKLEKKCKEKAEVWKKLKSMQPPKVD